MSGCSPIRKVAERVVDVRRIGVARDQLLERLLPGGVEPRRGEVGGAARQHHHLTLRSWDVRRQQRHAQRRDAERLDDARAVVVFARELAKDIQRLLVVFDPVQQNRRVVAHDPDESLFRCHAQGARPKQRRERVLITLLLVVAEALECPRVGVVGRQCE